jgi:hypothetical protein
MAWTLSAPQITDFFKTRMENYRTEAVALREAVEGEGVSIEDRTRLIEGLISNQLMMLAEDNIFITQIRFENYQSIFQQVSYFREFVESQRFTLKILFDFYSRTY